MGLEAIRLRVFYQGVLINWYEHLRNLYEGPRDHEARLSTYVDETLKSLPPPCKHVYGLGITVSAITLQILFSTFYC